MHTIERFFRILIPILYSFLFIIAIFLGFTLFWISISSYSLETFPVILKAAIRQGGDYSALLAAIIATVFFQSYTNIKKEEQNQDAKIKEIGHYALAFRKHESDTIISNEDFVVLITDDSDYQAGTSDSICFKLIFLTSKSEENCLKNIMAFKQEYFQNHKKEIIKNYQQYCQKTEYASPIFTRAIPSQATFNQDENCDFTLLIKQPQNGIMVFWITALTDTGVLYLNQVKIELKLLRKDRYYCTLLQQTNFFTQHGKVTALVQN